MSSSPSALAAALYNRTANQLNPTAGALLRGLHRYQAVHLSVGPEWCDMLSKPFILAGRFATPAQFPRAVRLYRDHTPYLGWGFAYDYPPSSASAAMAFTYADAGTARSDLLAREHILHTGMSMERNAPYSTLFRVTSGSAVGSTAVIGLVRPPGRRLPLANMSDNIDLGFARC
jgi:hypothetical protein